jgi:DNA processing protein
VTEQFSKELVESKFTIVSGMARGIDTIAHRQALKSGGRTIAVLGSGIDKIYPPENRKLSEQISENGAVISEYPFGTNPDGGNFPRRNRIISGLSLGILITEAGAKSGALITAFQALEQNREVFAVPGPINSGKSAGSNQLIKEGAKLVQGMQDILQELEGQVEQKISAPERKRPKLHGMEKNVYEFLNDEPVHVDALAMKAGKSVPEILTILLTLELMGVVKQLSGKMFVQV